MTKKIDHQAAVRLMSEAHPELVEELEDELIAGLLHCEVGCFMLFTQARIDAGDEDGVRACFQTALRLYREGDADVDNAIHVSYLEMLDFQDGEHRRAWAHALMPPALADAHREIMDWFADFARRNKG